MTQLIGTMDHQLPNPHQDSLPLQIQVDGLVGQLVEISGLAAIGEDGRKRLLPRYSSLLIQKDIDGVVVFREEVPSDFSCGDPFKDPVSTPPRLRVPARGPFNADGTPGFSVKYTKGC